jgi:hypothetical protein
MQIVGNNFKLSDSIALEKALTAQKKNKSDVNVSSSVLNALHKELGDFEVVL